MTPHAHNIETAARDLLQRLSADGRIGPVNQNSMRVTSFDDIPAREQSEVQHYRKICRTGLWGMREGVDENDVLAAHICHVVGDQNSRWVFKLTWTAPQAELDQLATECTYATHVDWCEVHDRTHTLPGAYRVYSDPGRPEDILLMDATIMPTYPVHKISVTFTEVAE